LHVAKILRTVIDITECALRPGINLSAEVCGLHWGQQAEQVDALALDTPPQEEVCNLYRWLVGSGQPREFHNAVNQVLYLGNLFVQELTHVCGRANGDLTHIMVYSVLCTFLIRVVSAAKWGTHNYESLRTLPPCLTPRWTTARLGPHSCLGLAQYHANLCQLLTGNVHSCAHQGVGKH
jgi:hypothetical protein